MRKAVWGRMFVLVTEQPNLSFHLGVNESSQHELGLAEKRRQLLHTKAQLSLETPFPVKKEVWRKKKTGKMKSSERHHKVYILCQADTLT